MNKYIENAIKYICIEAFDKNSKQFTKGDIYYIIIPLSFGGRTRTMFTESGDYIATIAITTFNKHLISLSEYREAQIQSVLN